MSSKMMDAELVREVVREGYGKIAETGAWSAGAGTGRDSSSDSRGGGGCCGTAGCGGSSPAGATELARNIGYAEEELASLPEGANLGLSCGNPTAIAGLRAGEVVLDLGSGGGFDCFVAGRKVGPSGRVIGVDMTAAMVGRARKNVAAYRERTGLDNVEFRLGEIENLPVADASVDVVISNCVLNLSPEKARVWREIARVMKPGGRLAVSDLGLLEPLPERVRSMVEALVGCVAGAVLLDETRRMMKEAGLEDIRLTPKPIYVKAMSEMQDPLYRKIAEQLPRGKTAADYIASVDISARKGTGKR